MDDLLNVIFIRELRLQKGVKIAWLSQFVGLSTGVGYKTFNLGFLPRDAKVRARILRKLADFFGVDERQLLVHPQAPKRLTA